MDDMTPVKWPNGARCAVMLTFDFDAETLWLSRDPDNARRSGFLSQGVYGAKTGVPKILELLRDERLTGTLPRVSPCCASSSPSCAAPVRGATGEQVANAWLRRPGHPEGLN
jgi:hypothetical protein